MRSVFIFNILVFAEEIKRLLFSSIIRVCHGTIDIVSIHTLRSVTSLIQYSKSCRHECCRPKGWRSVKKLPNIFYFRLGLLHSSAEDLVKNQAATRQKNSVLIYCDFNRDFIYLFIYLFHFMRA